MLRLVGSHVASVTCLWLNEIYNEPNEPSTSWRYPAHPKKHQQAMPPLKHPFSDGKLPFGWNSVPGYWPKRLIHVESIVSAERDDETVYHLGDTKIKEPEYSTLSYTWGRWRIKGPEAATSPALPVTGTPWPIPAVDSKHFTVDAFRTVVEQIASQGVDWVWIDIGCIDQRRDNPQEDFINTQAPIEMGRQAGIFKRAKNTYVWLCRLKNAELSAAVDGVQQYGLYLFEYIHGAHHKEPIPNDIVQMLKVNFDRIFSDPWFSSLWTLQEVVLRNDALVLSTEGLPIPWMRTAFTEHYTYLTMFINHCKNIYQDLERAIELTQRRSTFWRASHQAISAIHDIRKQILQAGLYYLFSTNPNVQYGTARYRNASRKEDRVYAIMQIYNLRVGKSANPNSNPTLDELETEFAGAINGRGAILGQYFVHTQDPGDGATWKITENSFVPDGLRMYRDPVDDATITVSKSGKGGVTTAIAISESGHGRFPLPFLDLSTRRFNLSRNREALSSDKQSPKQGKQTLSTVSKP
ncbi:hypothetical protein QBC40DRAFT_332622 [Triangularia verruculosa]|uniref:Heterokaryon incompatibility domain-containing protein n=1 Tax=Triangularia verruculosa TaxID=2587418 RepID=A0AAN6XHK3_9PEZI|nr:hypothetical protein QBC40DRAFT_332622 [Triangularia verruculosa]